MVTLILRNQLTLAPRTASSTPVSQEVIEISLSNTKFLTNSSQLLVVVHIRTEVVNSIGHPLDSSYPIHIPLQLSKFLTTSLAIDTYSTSSNRHASS